MMQQFSLPYPPSANRLWRSNRGRVHKSGEYKAWLFEAGLELRQLRIMPVKGKFTFSLLAFPPDNRHRDLDNIIKPVLDLLQATGVIENDHLNRGFVARWSGRRSGKDSARVQIKLRGYFDPLLREKL